jgi:hypothetical protein
MLEERTIDLTKFKDFGILEHLIDVGLVGTVDFIETYNETLVREFYSNLKPLITHTKGPFYQSIFVRGVITYFNLKPILDIFDITYHKDIEGFCEEVDLT